MAIQAYLFLGMRYYSKIGADHYTPEAIDAAINRLQWESVVTGMLLPFSQGYLINKMIKQYQWQGKVRALAYMGTICPTEKHCHEQECSCYGLIGFDVKTTKQEFKVYVADEGVSAVIVATDGVDG